MPEHALLLSIRPKYAAMIFDGTKTVELRRVRPRVTAGDLVLVYASSPVKALLGAFEVARVVTAPPSLLWKQVESKAGISRDQFNQYFNGVEESYGIFLKRKWALNEPVELDELRERQSNFRPPQSYHYLTPTQISRIGFGKLFANVGLNGN